MCGTEMETSKDTMNSLCFNSSVELFSSMNIIFPTEQIVVSGNMGSKFHQLTTNGVIIAFNVETETIFIFAKVEEHNAKGAVIMK